MITQYRIESQKSHFQMSWMKCYDLGIAQKLTNFGRSLKGGIDLIFHEMSVTDDAIRSPKIDYSLEPRDKNGFSECAQFAGNQTLPNPVLFRSFIGREHTYPYGRRRKKKAHSA